MSIEFYKEEIEKIASLSPEEKKELSELYTYVDGTLQKYDKERKSSKRRDLVAGLTATGGVTAAHLGLDSAIKNLNSAGISKSKDVLGDAIKHIKSNPKDFIRYGTAIGLGTGTLAGGIAYSLRNQKKFKERTKHIDKEIKAPTDRLIGLADRL